MSMITFGPKDHLGLTSSNRDNGLAMYNAITDITQEIKVVTDTALAAFGKDLASWAMLDFDFATLQSLLYQGFSAREVTRAVIASLKKNNVNDLEQQKVFIAVGVAIGHMVGKMSTKQYARLTPEGKDVYNNAKRVLNVMEGKPTKVHDITWARLGAAFPLQLCIISNRFPKSFASKYDSGDLPGFMRNASFPSLVPASEDFTLLMLHVYNCYSTDQSIALEGKMITNLTSDQLTGYYEKQWVFTMMSHNSGDVTNNLRIRAMRFFRVDQEAFYNKISAVFKLTGKDLKLLLPYDQYKEKVVALIKSINLEVAAGEACEAIPQAPLAPASKPGEV